MPVTVNTGMVATDDPLAADLAVSMDDKVVDLDVDTTQFTTLMMKLPSRTARSFKEEWESDVYLPKNTALAATAAAADTNLTLTTGEGSYAKAGDVAKLIQTGEAVRITAVSASAWTVVRAIGSVAAATAATGTTNGGIIILSGTNEQGATAPQATVTQLTADYNYLQITRTPYRYTKTAQWVKWYSGNPIVRQRKKRGTEHKREIEDTLFFGARSYTAGTTAPRPTAGGLDQYLSTNLKDAAGTFDKGELQDFLRDGLEYGNRSRKVLFAAPIVAQVLSEFLQDNWVRARPEDNIFGVKVDGIISGVTGGKVPVFVKNDWKRHSEGTGNHIGSRAYLVDMENVELIKAPAVDGEPRWMGLYRNREAPDADETLEEWLSEFSLQVQQEKTHSRWTGVTG